MKWNEFICDIFRKFRFYLIFMSFILMIGILFRRIVKYENLTWDNGTFVFFYDCSIFSRNKDPLYSIEWNQILCMFEHAYESYCLHCKYLFFFGIWMNIFLKNCTKLLLSHMIEIILCEYLVEPNVWHFSVLVNYVKWEKIFWNFYKNNLENNGLFENRIF